MAQCSPDECACVTQVIKLRFKDVRLRPTDRYLRVVQARRCLEVELEQVRLPLAIQVAT